jgi:hypothetical protein
MPIVISDPIAGASLTQIWQPTVGKVAGSTDADATAPFPLATRGLTEDTAKGVAIFARVTTGNVPNADGTTAIGVTNGLTAVTGAGNAWYNLTGKTPAVGDYLFLAAALATA